MDIFIDQSRGVALDGSHEEGSRSTAIARVRNDAKNMLTSTMLPADLFTSIALLQASTVWLHDADACKPLGEATQRAGRHAPSTARILKKSKTLMPAQLADARQRGRRLSSIPRRRYGCPSAGGKDA
jgi:hypothetical protein